jgi:hypothetical protein
MISADTKDIILILSQAYFVRLIDSSANRKFTMRSSLPVKMKRPDEKRSLSGYWNVTTTRAKERVSRGKNYVKGRKSSRRAHTGTLGVWIEHNEDIGY